MCIFGVCPTTSTEKCAQIEQYGIDLEHHSQWSWRLLLWLLLLLVVVVVVVVVVVFPPVLFLGLLLP